MPYKRFFNGVALVETWEDDKPLPVPSTANSRGLDALDHLSPLAMPPGSDVTQLSVAEFVEHGGQPASNPGLPATPVPTPADLPPAPPSLEPTAPPPVTEPLGGLKDWDGDGAPGGGPTAKSNPPNFAEMTKAELSLFIVEHGGQPLNSTENKAAFIAAAEKAAAIKQPGD